MESQPQNPEFSNYPEMFYPCLNILAILTDMLYLFPNIFLHFARTITYHLRLFLIHINNRASFNRLKLAVFGTSC